MSFLEQKLLPVSRQRYVTQYFTGASTMSETFYLAKAFILHDITLIMSDVHPSVDYFRAYMAAGNNPDLLLFLSQDMNASAQCYMPADGNYPLIMHEADLLFFAMLLSSTNTNWTLTVSGWAVTG